MQGTVVGHGQTTTSAEPEKIQVTKTGHIIARMKVTCEGHPNISTRLPEEDVQSQQTTKNDNFNKIINCLDLLTQHEYSSSMGMDEEDISQKAMHHTKPVNGDQ